MHFNSQQTSATQRAERLASLGEEVSRQLAGAKQIPMKPTSSVPSGETALPKNGSAVPDPRYLPFAGNGPLHIP